MTQKNAKIDLSVFGHVNIDEYLKVPKIPSFGSINIIKKETFLGGTAANIAKISAMLGLSVELYSVVSRTFPKKYITFLKAIGVNVENIVIDLNISHGPTCYIVSDGKKQVAYIDQGPMENMQNFKVKNLPRGNWIHFATGNPEVYIKVLKNHNFKRPKITFDPGQELTYKYNSANLLEFLNAAELTIMNEKEFEAAKKMIGIKPLKNAKNIIITRGEKGCTYFTKSINIKQSSVYSGDTTGSGDAFRAGLYFCLKNRYTITEACKIANKVAGIVIKHGIYNIDSKTLLSELY